ncbi:M14 family metallopeptidase [Nitrincola alkalilacustris]|uniref:M14 family metallopeptidase n=1 Tax=Nitrincola alkalilacustris TaxID=1571224 RepID=UPI00124E323D|nr:M14-type cytosolic carboxypeptidase [Nitrincola alkalilacustris]
MKISSQFDSGNIEVISANDPSDIRLAIRKDNQSDFFQWFHFRLHTTAGVPHRLRIMNASEAAYADGWHDYRAVASYDRESWFRVETEYDGKELSIDLTPEQNTLYLAYFAPYSFERHQDLLQQSQLSPLCEMVDLGETLDGRDLSMLVIGDSAPEKKVVWIIARQHPGETMAEWFIEGMLDRLLDEDDAVARKLLQECVFHVVPNMNPDGSVRGHLRTNAAGVNLNREWLEPSMKLSPEVFLVRQKMMETGVDLFLDIHGDENLPYNFVAGSEGIPSFDAHLKNLQDRFKAALLAATPDFQTEHGYAIDEPGKANLTMGSTWVGEHFKCLSYTVEMPFKDNADLPDELFGWSDTRSLGFGQDMLTAILAVCGQLRKTH